jgi:hypothetical protein
MKDSMDFVGIVNLKLYGPDGDLKQEVTTHNIIVNMGRAHVIDLLDKADVLLPNYVGIGDGTTAAAASDDSLVGALASASASPSQSVDAYTSRVAVTFASGTGTGTVKEVTRGMSTSDIIARTLLAESAQVNKGASDSLVVTYDITYASS